MDWSSFFSSPFFSMQRPDTSQENVRYTTASPLVNITDQDIDRGMNVAMSAGPGTLASFPLFHGSPVAGLREILPSERGALGPGAYFTPAENVAGRYGGNVYQLPEKPRDIFNGLGDRYGSYENWKADKSRLLDAVEPEKKVELQGILDKMWTNDGYPMHSRIAGMYRSEAKAQDLYKRAGFEGFAGHADGPEVVLFNRQGLK